VCAIHFNEFSKNLDGRLQVPKRILARKHSATFKECQRTIARPEPLADIRSEVSTQSEEPLEFVRKLNEGGSFESICLRCFLTLERCSTEAKLDLEEQKHVCDSRAVEHFRELKRLISAYRRQQRKK
jgi:hypothetical protein